MNEAEKSLAIDLAEVGLDLVLDEGLLKEIPYLGSLYTLTQTLVSVRDRIFALKVKRFLAKASEITASERQALAEELASDPKRKHALTEIILLSIEQADRLRKADLLAMVFRAYLRRDISADEFDQICHGVNRSDLNILFRFRDAVAADKEKNPKLMRIGFESLISAGLARGTGTMSMDNSGTFTRPTEIGLKLFNIIENENQGA